MTIEKKLLGTNPSGGGAVNVADVFSTYLYTGTGSAQTITNGIDLAGEGGLVWGKKRGFSVGHALFDTERVLDKRLSSNTTGAEVTRSGTISSFNSDGYSTGTGIDLNESGREIVSWTFRKAPKFFDVVSYVGNGVAGREISHGLDGPVGMLVIKALGLSRDWRVYHKSRGNAEALELNKTNASVGASDWFSTTPTDSVFTLSNDTDVNGNGYTYVAYLFADNSSEDAEEQMIKCGSYTGNGSYTGPEINLGWEPQLIMLKSATSVGDWPIYDNMRGIVTGDVDERIMANLSNAESSYNEVDLTPTGFALQATGSRTNTNGETYIYMAIRAPMMVEPESATDVFAIDTAKGTEPDWVGGFAPDMALFRYSLTTNNFSTASRLTQGKYLRTNDSTAEITDGNASAFDYSNGFGRNVGTSLPSSVGFMFKRAKGFFDVVTYTGDGVAGRTISHSLSVVPELILVKCRSIGFKWYIYSKSIPNTNYIRLSEDPPVLNVTAWNSTTPSSTTFTVGSAAQSNNASQSFIAYLFASLDGISKVGSYTGNGSNQTIACGFSAGARFILIKRTDAADNWYIWDTTRGIVAGNDPHLSLNTTAAQVTSDDSVDPANSGFIVNQVSATNINVSSGTYLFYAIA